MELFANRGYFFCRYCGTFHFPETTADQGVRVLAPSKEGLACPICKATLAAAMLDEAHPVHYCQTCRGVLLGRGVFADVIHHRRSYASEPPSPPVLLQKNELTREIHCPKCHATLNTHPYYGPGNVVIDSCGTCDVVWLDFGELKQIVDAPGRDRGVRQPPEPRPMPEPTSVRPLGRRAGRVDLFDALTDLF